MVFPEELFYSKSHTWVKFEDGTTASIGITEYAQSELGTLVAVTLPEEGGTVDYGDVVAGIESEDESEDVITPLSGKVTEVNQDLLESPDAVNDDPYEAWFLRISDINNREDLMDSVEYAEYVLKESKKSE